MFKKQKMERRDFLAGTAAIMAQATLPAGPSFAQQGGPAQNPGSASKSGSNSASKKIRPPASIVPTPNNPYFAPLGQPLEGTRPVPPPRSGTGLGPGPTASAPLGSSPLAAFFSSIFAPLISTALAQTSPNPATLVLYDTTGQWGWLGELYGMMTANLVSHFGSWTAMPVGAYSQGTINKYTAAIYIGSTYDEPLPTGFLLDVFGGSVPIIWIYDNIWQLTSAFPSFPTVYGWNWSGFDFSTVAEVDYKSQKLKRYAANGAGIMNYASIDSNVTVLASCIRSDGTSFPWALRSNNLTYIGENPLVYMSEGDRYLAFCDLLFDALAPATPTRHRALVRLEDIDPTFNPNTLKQIANWLSANKVPFGFQISPQYLDPLGVYNNGVPVSTALRTRPTLISALKYLQSKGGTLILHGWTHQYSNVPNPYTGVTGDDCEFFRITQNADHTLNYVGPVVEDTSPAWAMGRFSSAFAELTASGMSLPNCFTFPSYAASPFGYQAVTNFAPNGSRAFSTRAERSLYYSGLLSGGTVDYTRFAGQYFPYSVNDIYGCKVLADTLGGIQPEPFFSFPPRLPADIIADAQRTLVVRDGVASFFYNSSDSISYLQQTVNGLKSLGYTFVGQGSV
jgi:uncharacterized protein YdaL